MNTVVVMKRMKTVAMIESPGDPLSFLFTQIKLPRFNL